ncbi:MAG: hypothetical protein ACI8YI_002891, partial [Paracoccaceae bacterium]
VTTRKPTKFQKVATFCLNISKLAYLPCVV